VASKPAPSLTSTGRAIAAFTRTARTLSRRAGAVVARRGATVLGAAGLVSIAVGAGMVYRPAGLIVGGMLAVWFASLLPGGAK
jgi:hypothetical protein